MLRSVVALLALLVATLVASPARADLMDDSRALVAAWTGPTVAAKRMSTVFLHDGETRRVAFEDVRTPERACLSIVAIAERHQRFTITTSAAAQPVESRAGVARLTDCGEGSLTLKKSKRRVALSMGRGRGAIEIIAVSYATQITPVDVIVPERAVGPVGIDAKLAGALTLAPASKRVARARRSARIDGARTIIPMTLTAVDSGAGSAIIKLSAGCHRLHVIAHTGVGGAADVDADVRHHADGVVVARDRSHAPDARLSFCVGGAARFEVRFSGAPPRAKVSLLDAFWPIPSGVPVTWGARARAGLAWAIHRRTTPTPLHAPLFQSLGAPGETILPVSVVPGACYLAAYALARGQSAGGRLTVRTGHRQAYDDANDSMRSAALTFCAGPSDHVALLTVDVRSRDAWWVGMLWRIGGNDAF